MDSFSDASVNLSNFLGSVQPEAHCMSQQHQYGLLPCNLQGGVNHETAAKFPYLVRINRVYNAVNIHLSYPVASVRDQVKGRKQGGRGKPGLRIQR